MQLLYQTYLGLQQESLSTTSVNSERILGLKPCNRFKATKVATGSTPRMNAGACAPPFGQRACPPEDCGGAWNFMAQRQHYSIWYIADRFKEIVEQGEIADSTEEIHQLQRWLLVNHFDREEVNSRLKQYAAGERASTLFAERIG
jgi:hypothetical protein